MPDAVWHWSGYTLAAVAGVVVLWALFADRARGRRRCRRCWYDLTGLGEVPVTCPECGKGHARARQLGRTRRRWRRAAFGAVVLVASYGVWTTPRVIERGWYGAVPTTGLILVLPWLSREVPPLPTDVEADSDRAQRDAHLMALGGEMFRIMSKRPSCLADETAIRWKEMGTLPRRLYIAYWRKTGQLDKLSESPQLPYGSTKWTPSLLVFEAYTDELPGIPSEVSGSIVQGLLLSEQPALWSNITEPHYEIDPGTVVRQISHWLPRGTYIKISMQNEEGVTYSETMDTSKYKSEARSSWAGAAKSEFRLPILSTDSTVTLEYEVSCAGESGPIRIEIEYEIVPWRFEPEQARISWGVAVPRFIDGQVVIPRQTPKRSPLSHLREAMSERQDPP